MVTWVSLPRRAWVVARSYAEFVRVVEERGVPEFVSFDHDLEDEPPPTAAGKTTSPFRPNAAGRTTSPFSAGRTGADCALWLAERCVAGNVALPDYFIHSLNPIGQALIASILETARNVIAREHPGSEEWLAARKIVRDRTPGAGRRYLHQPSGRQLVRQRCMTEHQWKIALLEFGRAADRAQLG